MYWGTFGPEEIEKKPKSKTPKLITTLRSLQKGAKAFQAKKIFKQQAVLAKDYEPTAAELENLDIDYYNLFFSEIYANTYAKLSDVMLLRYFQWRSKLKKGVSAPYFDRSFPKIYISEIVSFSYVTDPNECLEKLLHLHKYLTEQKEAGSVSLVEEAVLEFCAYFGLSHPYINSFVLIDADAALDKLVHSNETSAEEMFDAVYTLCGLKLNSPLRRKNKALAEISLKLTFEKIEKHYDKYRQRDLLSTYFAYIRQNRYAGILSDFIFDPNIESKDGFSPSKYRSFKKNKENAFWTFTFPVYTGDGIKAFKRIVRAVDNRARKYTDLKPIKTAQLFKWEIKAIESSVEEAMEIIKREEETRVEIDFKALSSIRKEALNTMGKLITEEEKEAPPVKAAPVLPPSEPQGIVLEDTEKDLITALLRGTDLSFLSQKGIFPSLVAEEINNKFTEEMGDCVIEETDGSLSIIEDYRQDLEDILNNDR